MRYQYCILIEQTYIMFVQVVSILREHEFVSLERVDRVQITFCRCMDDKLFMKLTDLPVLCHDFLLVMYETH